MVRTYTKSIYFVFRMKGIASPTEAAALGAAAAAVLCIFYRQFNWEVFSGALRITVRITAMIMLIVAGGTMFTGAFAANGGAKLVQMLTSDLGLGSTGTIILFLGIVFLLGFVLDMWSRHREVLRALAAGQQDASTQQADDKRLTHENTPFLHAPYRRPSRLGPP